MRDVSVIWPRCIDPEWESEEKKRDLLRVEAPDMVPPSGLDIIEEKARFPLSMFGDDNMERRR